MIETTAKFLVTSQKKYSLRNTKFTEYEIRYPYQWPDKPWDMIIGIDPGNKNMGLTALPVVGQTLIKSYEICFPSERFAISRLVQIRLAISDIMYGTLHSRAHYKMLIALEGSAYSMPYRNTELAEARITAAAWFMDNFQLTQDSFVFLTPQTVRKTVFGNGKIKAETLWPQLKGDAASSLAIALAGLELKSV